MHLGDRLASMGAVSSQMLLVPTVVTYSVYEGLLG